jgi:parallel beta-helix repeat protein
MNISDRCKSKSDKSLLMIAAIIPSSLIAIIIPQPFIPQILAQEIKVENSIVYVDSQVGNDSNQGTVNAPLKTITQALKFAPDNTVISLAPGNYNEATGEVFPLIIKNNITLKGITGGQGNSVIIEGNGAFISPSAAEQNVTIAAIKNAGVITGVTVTNPHGRGHGLWIESANPQVSYSTFSRSGNTGLSVNGNSKPIISNNYFYRNGGNGLLIYGTSQAQITDNLFENTGFGVSLVQNSTSEIAKNTFQGNRIGVILEGNSQGILRDNTIINSLESGLIAIAESKVDLGISNQLGNNSFRNNKKLDIQNITANIISATGTEINGQIEGDVDFSNNAVSTVTVGQNIASNNNATTANVSSLRNLRSNPLPDKERAISITQSSVNNQEISNQETLPPPPPITNDSSQSTSQSTGKEYVFSAPGANIENNSMTSSESTNNNNLPLPNHNSTSSLSNQINSSNVSSLSDVLSTSNSSEIKYRVVVEANNNSQQAKIKSLYPQAFSTVYQGKSMLQVGAFSDRSKAEVTSRSLSDLGLNPHILD